MDGSAIITATAFAAAVTTLLMGFVGKVPLALAAGLSVSGVLASQVAPQMTWPQAMGMCVVYGVVICLLVVTGLREMIMNAIPLALKHAITMGIGLFVALIGFFKAGFVGKGPEFGPPSSSVRSVSSRAGPSCSSASPWSPSSCSRPARCPARS